MYVPILVLLLSSTGAYGMWQNTFALMMQAKSEQEKLSVVHAQPIDLRSVELDRSGMTLLHWAASKGHIPVMKVLIEQERFDVNAQTRSFHTPLDYALDVPTATYLLDEGACISDEEFSRATTRKSLDIAQLLLARRDYQISLLAMMRSFLPVIEKGDTRLCQMLLEKRVFPFDYQVRKAVNEGQVSIITVFERNGIDISKANKDADPLNTFAAIAYSHRDEAMLQKVISTVDSGAFMQARYDAWPEGLKLLFKTGFKPDQELAHDILLNAINEGNGECVSILLENTALRVQLIDIITALATHQIGILKILLVRCSQQELDAHLLHSVEIYNPDACQALLEAGACRTVRTQDGLTLLHVIVQKAAELHLTQHPHTNREDLEMQRRSNIDWLVEWKEVLTDARIGLYHPIRSPLKKLFELIRVLLLTPRYKDADAHKEQVRHMLTATYAKKYDKKHTKPLVLNPSEMAQRRGLAQPFIDLIDPKHREQWHPGIRIRYYRCYNK